MLATKIQKLFDTGAVEFVRFEQTDTHGIARSKTVPAKHFFSFAKKGLNFLLGQLGFDVQGMVAPGTGYLEDLGFPDSRIMPDLNTFQVLPWADKTARVLCEPHFIDGRPAMAAPRLVVRKLLDELHSMGYTLFGGFEYEFYLVDAATKVAPFQGIQIFATLRNNFDEAVVHDILRNMSAIGVDIITSNAEYGPGQLEINFAPAWGIDSADQAFTFKNGLKELMQRRGLMASFMTKPYADQSANGCHYHQSLWTGSGAKRKNAFLDASSADGLSDVCRHYIAGQIEHAAAVTAFAAPTVNCGKRYKQWSFAPTNATWGFENRTVGIRVKNTRDNATHIENRMGAGASNPYLLMAACVAAGIDGIRRKLEPASFIDGIAYGAQGVADLPTSLEASLDALERDEHLKEVLGGEFIKLYMAVKRHEAGKAKNAIANYGSAEFPNTVDQWERDEYFEFL